MDYLMQDTIGNATRYALTFAADCEPARINDCLYTHGFNVLAYTLGVIIETRRQEAEVQGKDFYPVAFAERAATEFNKLAKAPAFHNQEETPDRTMLKLLLIAGQMESDLIAA